jgi:hypothetical protein
MRQAFARWLVVFSLAGAGWLGFIDVGWVRASISLRFDPADTTFAPADTFTVSIVLDAEIELRSIEGYLTYDPSLLTRVGAWPGQLFDEQGPSPACPEPWNDCEEDLAGQLHFYAIAVGPECWLTGPGELYVLQFAALTPGTAILTATEVILYNLDGTPMDEEIVLPEARFVISDEVTGVPGRVPGLRFDLFPNPFNPLITLNFATPTTRPAKIVVCDLRGRYVATIWEGIASGLMTTSWDGTGTAGGRVASGTYWFSLEDDTGPLAVRKAVLVK